MSPSPRAATTRRGGRDAIPYAVPFPQSHLYHCRGLDFERQALHLDATAHTATCLGCGCTCTDIAVTALGDRFVQVKTDCALGVAWIGNGFAPARVLSSGAEVSLIEALDAAAATCATAPRRLLVYIADDVSAPAQRAAVALADRLQASVDGPTSDTVAVGFLAAQRRGRASATLGELKHRADVVIFWGVDPTKRYPRFIERFVSGPAAFAKQRTTIAIDVGEATGPIGCDERLAVPPGREVDALTAARAVVRDRQMPTLDEELSNVTELASRLLSEAKYVAIVFDAEPEATPRDPDLPEALIAFTQALNTRLRAALFGLRAGGNRNGFESLLTWQTGYPFSVSFASGAPRYEADETTSERLARGRYNAVLVVGSTDSLPPSIVGELRKRPTVIIGPRASEASFAAEVSIDTGVPGIHDDGLVLRMDDIPFEVQGVLSHPHRMEDLLLDLTKRITTFTSGP